MNPWAFWQLAACGVAIVTFRGLSADHLALRGAFGRALPFTVPGALLVDYALRVLGQLLRPASASPAHFGGVMAYGALASFVGFYVFFARYRTPSIAMALDRLAAPLALFVATGRIGCSVAGCERGAPTSLAWAMSPVHPVALYEALVSCGAALVGLVLLRRRAPAGTAFRFTVIAYAVGRIAVESLRVDAGRALGGLSTAQLLSIGVVFFALSWRGGARDQGLAQRS